ncbi:MAG: hypothetical protein ACREBS_08990 [Nitrososphaerales archaeon]
MIHKPKSALVFLYFDDSFQKLKLAQDELSQSSEFDDQSYNEISKTLEERGITTKLVIFKFVPDQPKLFLPQTIENISNASKEEIEMQALPILFFDEMLP